MTETNAKPIEPTCSMCPSYPRIQAEITRLTAEYQKWQKWHDYEYLERKKYLQDANHFAGEVQRLTAELKEREGEVEKLAHEQDLLENMSAMRLADQEAIERHVTKRVARECAAMASGCYYAKTMAEAIKKKYGVE